MPIEMRYGPNRPRPEDLIKRAIAILREDAEIETQHAGTFADEDPSNPSSNLATVRRFAGLALETAGSLEAVLASHRRGIRRAANPLFNKTDDKTLDSYIKQDDELYERYKKGL